MSGAAAGRQRGLLPWHRLRVTRGNQNPGNEKGEFERFGPKHPLSTEQVPASAGPCRAQPGLALARKSRRCRGGTPRAAPRTRGAPWQHREHSGKHREGSESTGLLLSGTLGSLTPCTAGERPLQGTLSSAPGSPRLSLGGLPWLGCGLEACPPRGWGSLSTRPGTFRRGAAGAGGEATSDPHKHPAAGTGLSSARSHSGKGHRGLQDSPWIPWNAQQWHCAPHSYRNST